MMACEHEVWQHNGTMHNSYACMMVAECAECGYIRLAGEYYGREILLLLGKHMDGKPLTDYFSLFLDNAAQKTGIITDPINDAWAKDQFADEAFKELEGMGFKL